MLHLHFLRKIFLDVQLIDVVCNEALVVFVYTKMNLAFRAENVRFISTRLQIAFQSSLRVLGKVIFLVIANQLSGGRYFVLLSFFIKRRLLVLDSEESNW